MDTFIKLQKQCPTSYQTFISLIETQFKTSIQFVRFDNGLEFTNTEASKYFQTKGIIQQIACPYTPQQNGIVEKKTQIPFRDC